MSAPAPRTPATPAPTAVKSDTRGNGFGLRSGSFSIQFLLPFTKDVVWAELIKATTPLGTEACELSIYEFTRVKDMGAPDLKGVGVQREANFSAPVQGSTVSELVGFKPKQQLRWKQLEATGSFQLAGNPTALIEGRPAFELGADQVAAGCPEMSIELVETGEGTEVSLTYEFQRVVLPPLLCWLSPVAPMLLRHLMTRSLPSQWHNSMVRRGHKALMTREEAATKMQALAKGRSARADPPAAGTPAAAKKPSPKPGPKPGVPGMMLSLDKKAVRSEEQRKADQVRPQPQAPSPSLSPSPSPNPNANPNPDPHH